MTADPRERVSEITEIYDNPAEEHIYGVFASVGWTTFVGTVAMSLTIAFSSAWPWQALLQAIFGGFIFIGIAVAIFSMLGLLVVGVPISFALRAMRKEGVATYAVVGALAGGATLAAVFEVDNFRDGGSLAFVAVGALCGAVCGFRWGRFRLAFISRKRRDPATNESTNPFHDMIH